VRFSDPDVNAGYFPPLILVSQLSHLNAALNFLSAAFLIFGFVFIKSRNIKAHKVSMLCAFASSSLFLISYLVYHYQVGSVPFKGQGPVRVIYFTILLTHTILAAAVVPLVLITLSRALKERFEAHRRLARWTFPIWLYVSLTGVVVYWMLYWLVPSA
jgi:uncharacterized membrane protein YozB (DUF420 family)